MKILCADALAEDLLRPLIDAGNEIVVDASLSGDTLVDKLRSNEFEVLVVRSTKVSEEALSANAALGLVVRAGAGTDNIDKAAASARGIYVANVPGKNAVAVAELTMALLLGIDRHIGSAHADLQVGQWNKGKYSKADGILGKQLGIIGLGEIGFALAERANAFDMTVVALRKSDRSNTALSRIRSAGIKLVDTLEELLGDSDVVSLHVPKSSDTTGMCDDAFFDMMKDGAILLNTARGEVVDEASLLRAMDAKGIRAGLDVWPGEPSAKATEWTSPLSQHPNVLGSHHIGASTEQAQNAVAAGTVAVIEAYVQGRVLNCVNLESEPLGEVVLTVRHLDKVGVLAKIFQTLRGAGVNVKQMENNVFDGSIAAVASINLSSEPPAGALTQIESDDDVLAVSVSRKVG